MKDAYVRERFSQDGRRDLRVSKGRTHEEPAADEKQGLGWG
jgi:hypothetical protein